MPCRTRRTADTKILQTLKAPGRYLLFALASRQILNRSTQRGDRALEPGWVPFADNQRRKAIS